MASVDRGNVNIFFRVEVQQTPALQNTPTSSGGSFIYAINNTPGNDQLDQRFGVWYETIVRPPPTHWLMQAYEAGGSCSGNVARTWISVGGPDLTGAQYTGARCSPTPGTFSNYSILKAW